MQVLSRFIYCSQIHPNCDVSAVGDIVKVARSFNKEHGITGILIFDGLRFCQCIEGPAEHLNALIERIAKDSRHINFTAKHSVDDVTERLFSNWSMAYVLGDDDEPLNALESLEVEGTSILERLQTLLPALDIA